MEKTVSEVFERNRSTGRGTLIGYFPIGYPTLGESIDAAVAMVENGVDILELGVPYSDPVMDGPVIQRATEIALNVGFKLDQIFEAVKTVRSRTDAPVLVMTYWNPVMQYGVQKFARNLKSSGGTGLITPDLIPDEADEWLRVSEELDLERVFLSAPSSSAERVLRTSELSRGFVYAVSTMGITGARDEVDTNARNVVKAVRSADPSQNVAIGIGISTGEQVKEVLSYADAAIVGSVFVKAYQEGKLPRLIEVTQELNPNRR